MFHRIGRCAGIPFSLASFSRPPIRSQEPYAAENDRFWYKSRSVPTQNILGYQEDTYGGIIFDFDPSSRSEDVFKEVLTRSIEHIRSAGHSRGIWLRIPKSHVSFIPICIDHFNFDFHHAEKGYVTLCKWLDPTKPNSLPGSATHNVGVGAVCISPDNKILLVREKSGPAALRRVWKLPTGRVEAGEDLPQAVIREVEEETGLVGEFDGVVSVRHSLHGAPYLGSKGDLFFICLIRIPDPSQLRLAADEIEEAEWVDPDDLFAKTGSEPGSSSFATMKAVSRVLESPRLVAERYPSWRGDFFTHFFIR